MGKLNAVLKVESAAAYNNGLMLQANIEDPTMIMMSSHFAVSHRLIISY